MKPHRKFEPVKLQPLHGQQAWVLGNDTVEMAVTRLGGQMAPVTFDVGGKSFQPYYISPWQGEKLPMPCPCLAPLRGDFFCLPFGGNLAPHKGERHPPHGETAGSVWKLEKHSTLDNVRTLSISLEPEVRPGRVTRHLSLVDGHSAIYSSTVIEGFAGATTFAHHAVLAVPEKERSLLISTSPFSLGRTFPGIFSDPRNREYQSLLPDAGFSRLDQVPSRFLDAPIADCSAFPTRHGYTDLIQQFEKPAPSAKSPAWVAAVNTADHWLWFAFKSPALMPGRIFWMDNHGRHGNPWNGRNACLGIEDGCMYFDCGITESARSNPVSKRGFPTHVKLSGSPFEVRYIQGAIRVPAKFKRVKTVKFQRDRVIFTDAGDCPAATCVNHAFLTGSDL
jgi:hypothetical protein